MSRHSFKTKRRAPVWPILRIEQGRNRQSVQMTPVLLAMLLPAALLPAALTPGLRHAACSSSRISSGPAPARRVSHRHLSGAATATLVSGWLPDLSAGSAHASSGAAAHASDSFPTIMLAVFLTMSAISLALSASPSGGGGGGGGRRSGAGGGSGGDRTGRTTPSSPVDLPLLMWNGASPLSAGHLAPFADGELQYIPAGAGFYTDDEVQTSAFSTSPLLLFNRNLDLKPPLP